MQAPIFILMYIIYRYLSYKVLKDICTLWGENENMQNVEITIFEILIKIIPLKDELTFLWSQCNKTFL